MTHPRTYPRTCLTCREKAVASTTMARDLDVKYEGVLHRLHVPALPVLRCESCGDVTESNDASDVVGLALRTQLMLLLPDEIRSNREHLKLTQQELADRLGCAAESISRWENGHLVQSRAYDRLLRAFFHLPALREFYVLISDQPWLGRAVVSAGEPA